MKGGDITFDGLLEELISTTATSMQAKSDIGIVEFAEDILFNGQTELFLHQRALLKGFYNQSLNEVEKIILEEWGKEGRTTWVEGRKYSNLVCEAGRGSCPSANSYIITTKGTITYGDLHKRLKKGEKVGIVTLDLNERNNKPRVSFDIKTWEEGINPAIRIITESGYEEICTLNHPYLTPNGWLLLEDMKEGEEVYIQREIPVFGKEEIGHDRASLLAQVIGEGDKVLRIVGDNPFVSDELRESMNWLREIEDPMKIVQRLTVKDLSIFLRVLFNIRAQVRKIGGVYQVTLNSLKEEEIKLIKIELVKFGVMSYIEKGILVIKGVESIFNLFTRIGLSRYEGEIREVIEEVMSNEEWKPKERLKRERVVKLERIEEEEIIGIEVLPTNVIGNTIVSHNSKSTLASIIALYEFYGLISLQNPAKYYNLLANDPIAIFVIATTQAQVKETLYAKIKGFAEQSDYFKSLVNTGFIQIQAESIRCPSKNVAIYAKHTNSPALVGYTLKALILDEVARFENRVENDGSITSTADDIWDNIGVAVKRFGSEGKRIAISSAWSINDPIERLWNLTQADKNSLGFKLRTWDLNKRPESNREACNSDYIKDRAKAELEYEGIRTKGVGRFITQEMLDKCSKSKSIIDTSEVDEDLEIEGDIRHYVAVNIERLEKVTRDYTYFLHVDFSIKRDATAICISHPVVEEDEEGNPSWCIKVDGLIKWSPYLDGKGIRRTVSYNNIEEVLLKLCEDRGIGKITFDSFNSISTIQRLHRLGLRTEEISSSRRNQLDYYTTVRDLINQTLVHLPLDSIYLSQLHSELTNLVLKPNGSITHGYIGKDLSDAFVNSVYQSYLHLISSGATNLHDIQSLINVNPASSLTKLIKTNPINPAKRTFGNKVNRVVNLRKRGVI